MTDYSIFFGFSDLDFSLLRITGSLSILQVFCFLLFTLSLSGRALSVQEALYAG